MSAKVADQLVEMILKAGIRRVYAITGDSLNEFNDAVRRNPELQWIHVRNEEVGAFAASADAQLSGLACCAGSSGPGHVHLVNGLYDAHRSGAPVLAIASTCATKEFGSGYFQETNVIKLFDDCSYYTQVAANAIQFPRMAHAAIQTAIMRKESPLSDFREMWQPFLKLKLIPQLRTIFANLQFVLNRKKCKNWRI